MGLSDIAEHARGYIQYLDWDAVMEKTGVETREDAVYTMAYRDEMEALADKALGIRKKLDLTWDVPTEDALVAWEACKQSLISKEGLFWDAVGANQKWLSDDVVMDTEVWRATVSRIYMTAMTAVMAHVNIMLQMDGRATPREIVDSANAAYAQLSAFCLLWDLGALNPLKKSSPTQVPGPTSVSGLGIVWTPAVLTAVVVAAVLIVAVISYAVVMNSKNEAAAAIAADICRTAAQEPDPATREQLLKACVSLAAVPEDPASNILKTVGVVLAIGGVVYAGVLLAPYLASSLRKARATPEHA